MGVDRKWSTGGQNDAIEPTRTFDLIIVSGWLGHLSLAGR
jgi:hypothetical protein